MLIGPPMREGGEEANLGGLDDEEEKGYDGSVGYREVGDSAPFVVWSVLPLPSHAKRRRLTSAVDSGAWSRLWCCWC